MKNIAMFIQSLEGGGAEKVVLTLARGIMRLGHRVHIILLQNKIDYPLDFEVQIHHFQVPRKKASLSWFYYRSQGRRFKHFLARLERESGPLDLVISHLTEADRILSAADLPRSFLCVHSATSRQKLGSATGLSLWLRRRKYRKIYDNRDIIAVSEGVGRDLVERVGVKPRSLRTIYNPFDYEALRDLAGRAAVIPCPEYVVHVGSFKEVKRHDILLKAFARSGLPCPLILLGKGALLPSVRHLAQQLGLGERVIFAGFQPNPYPWISKAKLLVLSSDYEGMALVLGEALALGVPVVSTDCPCGPDEILTGALSCGLTPVGDVEALAEKMRLVYGSVVPAQLREPERFSLRHIVKQYLALCGETKNMREDRD